MSFLPEAQHLTLLLCKLTVRQSQKLPPLASGQNVSFSQKNVTFSLGNGRWLFFSKGKMTFAFLLKISQGPTLMKDNGNNYMSFSLHSRFYFINSEITPVITNVACRQMSMTRKSWHLIFQECSLHTGWILIIPALATSCTNFIILTLQSFYVPIQEHNLIQVHEKLF